MTEWWPHGSAQYEAELLAESGPFVKVGRRWRRSHWTRRDMRLGECGVTVRVISYTKEAES